MANEAKIARALISVTDKTGVVEFVARWRDRDGTDGAMRERSRFARRAGRWFYLDGELFD